MFIVRSGMVKLERCDTSGEQLPSRILSTGDSFGEEILSGLQERYDYSVFAVEKRASLYVIEEEEFQILFAHMPDIRDQVAKNAESLYAASMRVATPMSNSS